MEVRPLLCLSSFMNFILFVRATLTLSYIGGGGGGGGAETPQAMKLKLSDIKDTSLRHFTSYTSPLHSEVLPWQQNYKRYLANFDSIQQ